MFHTHTHTSQYTNKYTNCGLEFHNLKTIYTSYYEQNLLLYILQWYITSGNIHFLDFLCYPLFTNTNMEHKFSYALDACSLLKGWRNSYRGGSCRWWYFVQMLGVASSNWPNWVSIPPPPLTRGWWQNLSVKWCVRFCVSETRKTDKIHKLNGTKTSYFLTHGVLVTWMPVTHAPIVSFWTY